MFGNVYATNNCILALAASISEIGDMAFAAMSRHPRASLKRDSTGSEMSLGLTSELGSEADVFRATLLWEKIVLHLEHSIKRGFRTQGLRIFGNCFQGCKAVDCLVVYLNTILAKTVERPQVLILCEKLLITGVIEDVRSKEKGSFRENSLYRFTGKHFWEGETTSSQEEGTLGGLPKSRSVENLAQKQQQSRSHRKAHSRGYTSDSTLGNSIHLGRKKRITGRARAITRPALLPSSHSRLIKSRPPLARIPQSPTHSPLEQGFQMLGSHTGLEHKRNGEMTVDDCGALSKQVATVQKERLKQNGVTKDPQPPASPTHRDIAMRSPTHKNSVTRSPTHKQCITSSPTHKDSIIRRDSAEKRHSLHMKSAQATREKDGIMQTCRNDAQQLVTGNPECANQSNSTNHLNPINESPEGAQKWIVYGFV